MANNEKLTSFVATLEKYPSEAGNGVTVAGVLQEIDDRISAMEAIITKISSELAPALASLHQDVDNRLTSLETATQQVSSDIVGSPKSQ